MADEKIPKEAACPEHGTDHLVTFPFDNPKRWHCAYGDTHHIYTEPNWRQAEGVLHGVGSDEPADVTIRRLRGHE